MGKAKMQKVGVSVTKRMFPKYGGTATYTVVIPEHTDQDTGNTIPKEETPYEISPVPRKSTVEDRDIAQISSTQKIFMIRASELPIEPSSSDTITYLGNTLLFRELLKTVDPGAGAVQYDVLFGV